MKFKLLLTLTLFCNLLTAQKKTHSISIMLGVPLVTKGYFYNYAIPLSFEYRFRIGRNGFSIGLQPEYRGYNWQFKGDSGDFVKFCKSFPVNIPTSLFSSPVCNYSQKRQYLYINFPVFYSFLLLDKNKITSSIETGLLLNYNFYSYLKSEYPMLDSQNNITDLGPFTDERSSKRFVSDGFHGAMRGVLSYKLSKKIAVSAALEYQRGFYDFSMRSNGSNKLFVQLGTAFKI